MYYNHQKAKPTSCNTPPNIATTSLPIIKFYNPFENRMSQLLPLRHDSALHTFFFIERSTLFISKAVIKKVPANLGMGLSSVN